ncbi:hypothetical protein D3C86_2101010 [compost metagenome]
MKDDKGGVLWRFTAEPNELAPAQVALHDPWLDRGGDLHGRLQIGKPFRLLRPDQCLKPCDLRRI